MDALSEANTSTHLVKIVTKLPTVDQAKWRDRMQTLRATGQQPGLKHIVEFVERRAEALNDPIFGALTLPTSAPTSAAKAQQVPSPARVTTMATSVENSGEKPLLCIDCRKAHSLESCPAFWKKTIEERRRFVLNKRLCMNCLNCVDTSPQHAGRSGGVRVAARNITRCCTRVTLHQPRLLHQHKRRRQHHVATQAPRRRVEQSSELHAATRRLHCRLFRSTSLPEANPQSRLAFLTLGRKPCWCPRL